MPSRKRDAGFSLVELMIVVAVLAILSAIAMVGYRKYVARARASEAVAMLAEIASKEQLYFLEFAGYLPLRADDAAAPSVNENAAAFFPMSPADPTFESVRSARLITGAWPNSWRSVGLRPRASVLYCSYLANAGGAGQAAPATFGSQMLTIAPTSPPWFYALAACNLNGASGWPNAVTTFALTSTSPALRTFNDGL